MGVFLTGFSVVVNVARRESKSAEVLEPLFAVVVDGLTTGVVLVLADDLSLLSILAKISLGDFDLLVSVILILLYVNLSKYRIYILQSIKISKIEMV